MASEAIVAPALSTTQDEEFAFAKTREVTPSLLREKRQHLGIQYMSNPNVSLAETRELIHEYYSLDRLITLLNKRETNGDLKHKLVALQFPDNLIYDSTIVSQILQDHLNILNKKFHAEHHVENTQKIITTQTEIDFTVASETMSRDIESIDKKTCSGNCGSTCKNKNKFQQNIWILADTSYSPCCIDEVAAEHVKADLVVHFGDACLNPVEKINAAYVFGRPYVNFEKLVLKFRKIYSDTDQKITIMADIPYSYIIGRLYKVLSDDYNNLLFADVDYKKCGSNATIIDKYSEHESSFEENFFAIKTADRILHGSNNQLESIEEEDYDRFTQEYSLFHITKPEDPRLLFLSTKFSEIKAIEPSTLEINHDQFPTLMKRYKYMHMARNASTVGILVNTLSLSNTNVLLNKVIKWVKEADKKHYMFVVGKPNVAKLANFENVDVWCVLGCGQSGIVIDMFGEYYKPIITPYELQLALMPHVTWTGKWVTDFEALMKEDNHECGKEEEKHDGKSDRNKALVENLEDDDDQYAPQFNPVTGKLTVNKPLRQLKHLELELEQEQINSKGQKNNDNVNQLVKKFSGSLSIKNTVSTSAFALQNREWTGLGSDFKDAEENGEYSPEGAIIEEGMFGIARDYNHDV